jgi:voltage-gated potassium channel
MLDDVKARLNDVLNNESGDAVGWAVTIFIVALIILSVAVAILDTVEELPVEYKIAFYWIEVVTLIIFTVEYVLRLWSCTADEEFHDPLKGRLLYIITPFALIDFVAIFPSYITFLPGAAVVDLLFLRSIRLLRVFRVFKLGRYNDAFTTVKKVVYSKKDELFVVVFIGMITIIVSASVMYLAEPHTNTPFNSIPDCMWWSIETLTSVGYGDAVPVTAVGKLFGSIIALTGIAFIALPAGILGAGFLEEFQHRRNENSQTKSNSPQNVSVADEIRKLVNLRDDGHITEEEFNEQKAQSLKRNRLT